MDYEASVAAKRSWEGVQMVPEKEDYWSDTCCSFHDNESCSDEYEEESDTSTGESSTDSEAETDTDEEEEDLAIDTDEINAEQSIIQPEMIVEEVIPIPDHPEPSWEQLSSECVRQKVRELEDPQMQKEFYDRLGRVCSGLAESIKRQRVM